MDYETIRSNPKQFAAVCGLSVAEFDLLLDRFAPLVEKRLQTHHLQVDLAKLNALTNSGSQLFFILTYLKNNPNLAYLAVGFDMMPDCASWWIHFLKPVLHEALEPFPPDPDSPFPSPTRKFSLIQRKIIIYK